MTPMQMLDELREHHVVEIRSHSDGRAMVNVRPLDEDETREFTYYGKLESCIARAWAGEPSDY